MRLPIPIALVCLALAGCASAAKDLGTAGAHPGIIVCAGKFSLSAVGEVQMIGANASITGDCGAGAYFGQGYPAAQLPNAQPSGAATIVMPPLQNPPTSGSTNP